MPTFQDIKTKIQGLINQGNTATGNSDTDLTSVINALISGFGQGGSSGGSSPIIKTGTFTGTGAVVTIEHNIGAIPDIFFVVTPTSSSSGKTYAIMCIGFSPSFHNKMFPNWNRHQIECRYASSKALYNQLTYEITNTIGCLNNANETTIGFGGSNTSLSLSGATYDWLAIGGLA